MCVKEWPFITRGRSQGFGGGEGVRVFLLEKGVLKVFFCLKIGCWSLFCRIKFTDFVKDVTSYEKQLKFMVLAHSKGGVESFFEVGSKFFFCLIKILGVLNLFCCILTQNPWPPPSGNKSLLLKTTWQKNKYSQYNISVCINCKVESWPTVLSLHICVTTGSLTISSGWW